MSLIIAYLIIGVVMTGGLIADRWECMELGKGWISTTIAVLVVLVFNALLWPGLLHKGNMIGDKP